MDFATVKSKVDSSAYKGPQDFFDDMKLVFSNARRLNPPGSCVNLLANGVEVSPFRRVLSGSHVLTVHVSLAGTRT